jgi:hypothetical protein
MRKRPYILLNQKGEKARANARPLVLATGKTINLRTITGDPASE